MINIFKKTHQHPATNKPRTVDAWLADDGTVGISAWTYGPKGGMITGGGINLSMDELRAIVDAAEQKTQEALEKELRGD